MYHYFDHPYNTTRFNERTVEVPIILAEVERAKGKMILELGNVLSHYVDFPHDIVDKYEEAPGVINEDIIAYKPNKKYDLIVAISTLEHVGWDEFPRSKSKIPKAINHLTTLLNKHGKLIFTVPIAINDYLDVMLHDHSLPVDQLFFLKRTTADNTWQEKSWEQVRYCLYDTPFSNANGIAIGVVTK